MGSVRGYLKNSFSNPAPATNLTMLVSRHCLGVGLAAGISLPVYGQEAVIVKVFENLTEFVH